jgi:dTDP-4-amino-4,6-dideoxygalactose transaminase
MLNLLDEKVSELVKDYLVGKYEPSVDQVEKFELEFSKFMGMENFITVSSGSAALHLALLACDIGPGDEVITIANSCIAVSDSVLWCGAVPIFVDVELETYNMDPNLIESKITSNTKAIIPVHLYGNPVNMDPILEIAEKFDLLIIEDAAQAAGAVYKGKKVGTFGIVGCFSFPKNLGGYGGGVLTNDKNISAKVSMLRHFGRLGKSPKQEFLGYRYTLSNLNALINRLQIKNLDLNNEKRIKTAKRYCKFLKDIPKIHLPKAETWGKHVYYRFVPLVERREELLKYCSKNGVFIRKGYSIPVYDQGAYKVFNVKSENFPITNIISNKGISLPTHPNLKELEIKKIPDVINSFYQD